jgi:hypothetical protein
VTARGGAGELQSDDRLIALFLEMMTVDRSAAAMTLKNYGRDLKRFAAFVRKRKESLLTAGADDISAFLSALEKEGLSGDGGVEGVRDPSVLFISLCRGPSRRQPGDARRPAQNAPSAAESSLG